MSQLITKFIEDNAVTDAKIRLRNNAPLRARNALGTADVDLFKLDSSDSFTVMSQPRAAAALALPSQAKDYVTIEWAENRIVGKGDPKDAVLAAATGNVALTGATPLVIDDITIGNNKRVLLPVQTTGSQNGVYVCVIVGGNYTLSRAPDFDQVDDEYTAEVTNGAYFKITSGTNYANWEAILTNADPIVVGTDTLTFALNPTLTALVAGDGISRTGNTISVDYATNGGLESTNPGNINGQLRVKTDSSAAEKDITIRRSSVDGSIVAKKSRQLTIVLTNTDIVNQYADLDAVAGDSSVMLTVVGGGKQTVGYDFSVNYTAGVGGNTRIGLLNGLASGGVSELVVGDVLDTNFMSF